MKRRTFIQHVSAASLILAGNSLLSSTSAAANSKQKLTGFIVSDAHFGWENAQQPTPEHQRQAMRQILGRFPDLDILIDTGDAYHGNLRGADGDKARGDWTDIIANESGPLPFLYVPGNHEIVGAAEGDNEERCCRLGSLSCRPYYSFDLKGIHFVSLPELVRAIYITRETLEWLALDLEVHNNKTTIILSHNNIIGATGPYEEGYRGVVNSEALMALFSRHPQVIAWMHGHNHNYEVAHHRGLLHVSNGRIGGFDPSRQAPEGSHGLGGIYFEVTNEGLNVRSYSADRDAYLDEEGINGTSGAVARKTSFSPEAAPACCFGYGGMRDGQRIPVYHHFAGARTTRTLYIAEADAPDFNDDPDFTLYAARGDETRREPQKMLMGSDVRGPGASWRWENPGVRLLRRGDGPRRHVFSLPRANQGEVAYYRCAPERSYVYHLTMDCSAAGGKVLLRGKMHDSNGRLLHTAPVMTEALREGKQTLAYAIDIPALNTTENIYDDTTLDIMTHLMIEHEFSDAPGDILLTRAALQLAGLKDEQYAILINDTVHEFSRAPERKSFEPLVAHPAETAREVVSCRAGNSGRLTWLMRHEGVAWQVRNAAAAIRAGRLDIGPIRNTWLSPGVIVIAPLTPLEAPYVHRLTGVSAVSIETASEDRPTVRLENTVWAEGATIEIRSTISPTHIEGASLILSEVTRHLFEIKDASVCVTFA